MTSTADQPLATAADVARILGVTRSRVLELAASIPDFPPAERAATGGRVWVRATIEAWAAARPDRGPLHTGLTVPQVGAWPEQVQTVASLAAAEARALHHDWVGQDHLVLALLHPDCPGRARAVLTSLGVTAAPLREAFVASMGDPHEPNRRGMTWSPAAQLLLARANVEAVALADAEVASEHILLALLSRCTSWWIASTRSTPALRSAVASSLPTSRSPYRIGSAKYPQQRLAAGLYISSW